METSFREQYGFDHDCHCEEDAVLGRLATVSVCFTEMCEQALEACAELKLRNADERAANAQLRIQLKELGVEPRV